MGDHQGGIQSEFNHELASWERAVLILLFLFDCLEKDRGVIVPEISSLPSGWDALKSPH